MKSQRSQLARIVSVLVFSGIRPVYTRQLYWLRKFAAMQHCKTGFTLIRTKIDIQVEFGISLNQSHCSLGN